MPIDLVGGQARELLQRPDHGVQRVGDADDEGLGGILGLMPAPTCSITLRLMPSRSSRLMPGLRGNTGGDDADVGAFDVSVFARTGELGIEAFDRAGLGNVETLALRDAVGNVEQDDVAEFLQTAEMRQRSTDHDQSR